MDSNKTGLFIAELRKQKGYTQKELAEKLMVTDKAVSRWETGKGFPDTSLLRNLSNILGVSVGELLSGEHIEETNMKEKTDQIILDSLKYSAQILTRMINGALLTVGIILLLTPVFMASRNYSFYGLILIGITITHMILKRLNLNMKITNKTIYASAIICQIAAIVLEILPYGVILIIAPGPNERITATFSYFSLTPFGNANFFPLPTGMLTVVAFLLCVINLFKKSDVLKLRNAAFVCNIIAVILSVMPLLLFGNQYMNTVSYFVSALLLISTVLQSIVNRHLYRVC